MKKIISFLILVVVIAGCNSKPNWEASIETTPYYNEKTPSVVEFKITDHDEPVSGLSVAALFEMTKMDHGTIELTLDETDNGIYQGEIEIPMEGEWQATLTMEKDNQSVEQIVTFEVEKATGVASINGDIIHKADIEFYKFINDMQISMYEEADKQKYEGDALDKALAYWAQQRKVGQDRNTLLSQIIRLRAAALLGEEKGHQATEQEVANAIEQVKQQYAQSEVATEMIQNYGEEKFWEKQKSQYKLIVLTQKVQADVIEMVKKENPDAQQNEINVLAQKKYEELLVSQVSTLDIKVF